MWRNYLAAAVGNLARSRLYTAITVAGLAIAFAAAILIGLYVRGEFGFERFIAGYAQVYRISETLGFPGRQSLKLDVTPQRDLAKQIQLGFGGVEATARLFWAPAEVRGRPADPVVAEQNFAWADPDIFTVLPLPTLAGDPATALDRPDAVVLTRQAARRYFGLGVPLGWTLEVNGHPMRVTAVLRDLPSDTHFTTQVFASARAAFSDAREDATGFAPYTYVRLRAGADAAGLSQALARMAKAHAAGDEHAVLVPVPLADIHLTPAGMNAPGAKLPADRRALAAVMGVGILIVLVASINFVTLVTARGVRRAVEVAVRKVAGARRRDLVAQFMAEALILVGLAMVLAMAMAELLLRPLNAILQRDLKIDYANDPWLLGAVVALTAAVGGLAGLYPAFLLSGFRPATALRGGPTRTPGSGRARQVLVGVQFTVFIALLVVSFTIYRQTMLALHEGLAAQKAPILLITTPCAGALPAEVAKLPGVSAAACSSQAGGTFIEEVGRSTVTTPRGDLSFVMAPVDFGFLDLYGLTPLAGRLFDRHHGEDGVLARPDTREQPSVVINQSAVRALGFASARAAVGRTMTWTRYADALPAPQVAPSEIVGVVRDAPTSAREAAGATFYYIDPPKNGLLSVRLDGREPAVTMGAIARLWPRLGDGHPLRARLLAEVREDQYRDIIFEGVAIGVCSALAVIIACLGLFALSAFTTERRTKEIGIRKALGAGTGDVVRLLLWQFTVPVLVANLIAWPIAWWTMSRWLEGFAYHVDLPAWLFLVSGAAAVVIAWATVAAHIWLVARSRPVEALRYE